MRDLVEHFAEHLKAAGQFGFTLWSRYEMAAVGTFVNLDALDVDPSAGKDERIGCGAALQIAAAALGAGAWLWHG